VSATITDSPHIVALVRATNLQRIGRI